MSVPEMGKMLGLGKVESYWLVKKNYFKTIQVAGRMRVMLDSFEDWYAGQFHYTVSVSGHIRQQHRHRKWFPLISWDFCLVYETPGLGQTLSR